MPNVLFANHLKLGSASSYRQIGFAKYLTATGYQTSFLGRANPPSGNLGGQPKRKENSEPEVPNPFAPIDYWKEPLMSKFFFNVELFRRATRSSQIIHVNRANPYTASVISAARSSQKKLIVDMEDWDGFGGYSSFANKYGAAGGLLTFYEEFFPRTADAVVVVSRLLSERMLRAGVPKSKLFLIPNGFDPELFNSKIPGDEMKKAYGLEDSPVVIYASTFWDFEAMLHEIALAAFKKIAKESPDVKFLLVGSGNLAMQKLISEYGLGKNAVATGFVPRNHVPQLMAAADVAIHVISNHPFHAASSPMIIPEYMAVGKPIVAPRIGELGVMLEDEAGFLVDRPDATLLAEGVSELLNDGGLRMRLGQRAATRASRNYSYTVLTKLLEEAYQHAWR